MFKNYLKVTLRNLLKNKVFVSINIVGLGLALACCIIAYLNSQFDWDFDKNHKHIDHIYKVHHLKENQGQLIEYGNSPIPMADAIANDLTGVDKVFRFWRHVFTVKDVNQDKIFHTSVCYADAGFFESFTFPVVYGSADAFHKLDNAVVTEEYAKKFYGDENPIGKVLTIFDDNGLNFNFVISGVVQRAPQNSSIQFEVLLNFENRDRMYDDNVKGNWGAFTEATFLYFENPAKAKEIEPLLAKYIPIQNAAREDWIISKFILTPMSNHAHISRNIRIDGLRDAMDPAALITPQIMALLILLVACFNFTNTAIATSNRRLKEIGIRKVMGGNRRQLIIQFMCENIVICFLGILMSVAIASFLVPAYSAMWNGMDLELNFVENLRLYLFLFGMLIFTALLAGLYPSLYISKYEPVSILRASLSIGGSSRLTKILLTAQYTFTVIALFASIAFIQNAKYQEQLDMGFNLEQIIGVSLLNENQHQKMEASMLASPNLEMVASTRNHIGRGNYSRTLKNQDVEIESDMMDFGPGYMDLMGLTIIKGRGFTKELQASDAMSSIIVNEKMVEEFGWEEPLGQRISVDDSTTLTVIGVVKNYHMYGFWRPINPVGMRLNESNFNYIVGKVGLSDTKPTFDYLESEWNRKIPTKTFAGFYQDEILRQAKEVNDNIVIIFSFLGSIALVLSCLGLFTLVSLNLIKRIKEIGVRKVLGGSLIHIVQLINKDFLLLLIISSTIGVVMGYYLIDALISDIFTYYKDMDLYTFGIPIVVIVGLSLLISSLRTLKSARVNPVDSLRYE